MIRVTVELWPQGDRSRSRVLGTLNICNTGGTEEVSQYQGSLVGEYTDDNARRGLVGNFNRKRQSVWSLIGAFLKLWGHTKHSPKDMTLRPEQALEKYRA